MIQRPNNNPRNGDSVSLRPKKLSSKVLASVYRDRDWILLVHYLEEDATITAKYCIALLHKLKQQLVSKHQGKLLKWILFLQDYCSWQGGHYGFYSFVFQKLFFLCFFKKFSYFPCFFSTICESMSFSFLVFLSVLFCLCWLKCFLSGFILCLFYSAFFNYVYLHFLRVCG
jgi:hypothetical protein